MAVSESGSLCAGRDCATPIIAASPEDGADQMTDTRHRLHVNQDAVPAGTTGAWGPGVRPLSEPVDERRRILINLQRGLDRERQFFR